MKKFFSLIVIAILTFSLTGSGYNNSTKVNDSTKAMILLPFNSLSLIKFSDNIMVDVLDNKEKEEITMIAKVIYQEARGLPTEHQEAVVWTILNRVDDSRKRFGETIEEVITSPYQYAWYENTPVTKKQYSIAYEVYNKWKKEKITGIEDRVLPKDYYFFSAGNDNTNWFRKEFNSTEYWNWDYSKK